MNPDSQVAAMQRGQITNRIFGTVFLFFGVLAGAIAAIRRRCGVRPILWLGVWSAMYGLRQLAESSAGEHSPD